MLVVQVFVKLLQSVMLLLGDYESFFFSAINPRVFLFLFRAPIFERILIVKPSVEKGRMQKMLFLIDWNISMDI